VEQLDTDQGGLTEKITKLKLQPGKDIAISGSANLVRSLLQEALLDELRLMVHPVVVGSGKRLFEDGVNGGVGILGSSLPTTNQRQK